MSSYGAYLAAKRTVDDRALNRHVLDVLRRELRGQPDALRVLEVGAGIGTMVPRLADWDVVTRAEYTLLDQDASMLETVPARLSSWAETSGRRVREEGDAVLVHGGAPEVDLTVRCVPSELDEHLAVSGASSGVDLLIANAFLDLVDVPATLPPLLAMLAPEGLYWFTINFDGETIFLPEHPVDGRLIEAYHLSMDTRVRRGRRAGDSRTGRHLFEHLRTAGATVLAAGSSDWVVYPVEGAYPDGEGVFLESILRTIEEEPACQSAVDRRDLDAWLAARREQLARAELVYIAHQLDFVGRRG